ncbi:MAG: nodulation protein NfeD, partial [Chloroflexi bacterium]|nr:nodulation protein NfeD [Chloroflexota bacterium]
MMRARATRPRSVLDLRALAFSAAWLAVVGLFVPWSAAVANGDYVAVARVKGAINPVTTGYLTRAIDEAESSGATALVIEMDTPGGLDSAMRDIIQRIVAARVPIVVYVSPAGSRAASAGAFIAMAAHVSAMAPNTSIGAAHPVAAGGPQPEGAVADKVLNDAASYIRSLARDRGRNVEWAERAVRESVSANEQEAVRDNIVDLTAPNLVALLDMLEGRSIRLASGPVTLRVKGLPTSAIEMTAIESFLFTITDPNIAFILLSLALTAIFLELSNP